MGDFESLKVLGFDHLEFAVEDLDIAGRLYRNLGFQLVAKRELSGRKLRSHLFHQNHTVIVLSQSEDPKDPVAQYVEKHGEGVCNVAYRVEEVVPTLEKLADRGAEVVQPPKTFQSEFGEVETAFIKVFGDVTHSLISRKGGFFGEGFNENLTFPGPEGFGLQGIDHLTNNVEKGKMDYWAEYYEKVFGLKCTRFFDIHTTRTGLLSRVMESPNGVIKMPINEPVGKDSQIQEFLDIHHGPGIQHAALNTNDICETMNPLLKNGIEFLKVPHTYYQALPDRLPNLTENLLRLEKLGILADGDPKGYLLQIFSNPVVGPFFYEIIQRKNHGGFGEGNFQALFEAMERDQIQRGVLSA